jgi:ArsR family transcriptional regulator
MSDIDYDLLSKKAEILKVIAHPVRLAILKGLIENGPTSVSKMETGIENYLTSTISLHLNKIKSTGLLKTKRKGTYIYYSLVDKENIVAALKIFLY